MTCSNGYARHINVITDGVTSECNVVVDIAMKTNKMVFFRERHEREEESNFRGEDTIPFGEALQNKYR